MRRGEAGGGGEAGRDAGGLNERACVFQGEIPKRSAPRRGPADPARRDARLSAARAFECAYTVDTGLLSLGQWREKRALTVNGAEALTSIAVQFVDSPSMAAARESAKLLAPAAEPK